MRHVWILVGLLGCASQPTAEQVCKKIEAAGIAKGCHETKPEALSARAKTRFDFDLVNVPGKTGHVLSFGDAEGYIATVKGYDAVAVLAGPHRYGSEKARIFVQFNSGASLEEGKKVKGVVDAL